MKTKTNCSRTIQGRSILKVLSILVLLFFAGSRSLKAQEDENTEAIITLKFQMEDSVRTCVATLTSEGKPIAEKEINFFVKRLFSDLPIGKGAETDEEGNASMEFPADLPGDEKGVYTVIARLEDDDDFGTLEAKEDVQWGIPLKTGDDHWGERSLSASRNLAPTYLIITSNLIIAFIWGTIAYLFYQLIRINRSGKKKVSA